MAVLITTSTYALDSKYQFSYQDEGSFQLVTFAGELPVAIFNQNFRNTVKSVHGRSNIVLKVGRSGGGFTANFKRIIKTLRNRCSQLRGSRCHVSAIFTDMCASACTFLPLLADYSISLGNVEYGFHSQWIINPNLKIRTENGFVRRYVELGANKNWFEKNKKRLLANQVNGIWIGAFEVRDAGLIDEIVPTYRSFIEKYY